MKSTDVRILEPLVKKVFPMAETDNIALMTYIANYLWITMSEKNQKIVIANLTKQESK